MIPRRLAAAIRTANYGALLLEMLVVVVGVLLALAADRWNQDRLDAIETARIVARLKSDTARNLAVFDESLPGMQRDLDDIKRLYLALHAGAVPAADARRIESALTNLDVVPSYPLLFAAYDELVATGRLRQLDDPELIDLLGKQRAEYDSAQTVVGYWRDILLAAKPDINRRVDFFYASDRMDEASMAVRFDFAELAANRDVKNLVFEAIDVHQDWLNRQLALHDISLQIAARLGITRETGAAP